MENAKLWKPGGKCFALYWKTQVLPSRSCNSILQVWQQCMETEVLLSNIRPIQIEAARKTTSKTKLLTSAEEVMATQDDALSQPNSSTNLPRLRTNNEKSLCEESSGDWNILVNTCCQTSYFPNRIKCSHGGYYHLENEKADFRGKRIQPTQRMGKNVQLNKAKNFYKWKREFFLLPSIKPMHCYKINK